MEATRDGLWDWNIQTGAVWIEDDQGVEVLPRESRAVTIQPLGGGKETLIVRIPEKTLGSGLRYCNFSLVSSIKKLAVLNSDFGMRIDIEGAVFSLHD
jgi:hypothetical protein